MPTAQGLGGVLDDRDAESVADLNDLFVIRTLPVEVHSDDGLW